MVKETLNISEALYLFRRQTNMVRRKRKGTTFQRCMKAKLKGRKFASKTTLRKAFKQAVKACKLKPVRHRRARHVVRHRIHRVRRKR